MSRSDETDVSHDDDTRDLVCPICLRANDDSDANTGTLNWVIMNPATCGHVMCRSCLDRLLLAPPPSSRAASRAVATTGTTCTLGMCPVCRSQVSYFDAIDYVTRKPLFDSSALDERLQGAIFLEVGSQGVGWSTLHFPSMMRDKSETSATTEICSKRDADHDIGFVEEHKQHEKDDVSWDGVNSMHCRSDFGVDNVHHTVPYLNCEKVPGTAAAGHPLRVRFLKSSRYHAPTHTWEGRADYQGKRDVSGEIHAANAQLIAANIPQQMTWQFILTFSDDFKFVTQGVMIRTVIYGQASIRSVNVSHPTPSLQTEILAMGGGKGSLMIRLPVVHNETKLSTTKQFPFSLDRIIRPTYHANGPWGNTFCQFLQVGLMSLHFVRLRDSTRTTICNGNVDPDSESDGVKNDTDDDGHVYMSFEHSGVARIPPLDNGHPLPSRLPCRQVVVSSHDDTDNTGTLPWVRGEFDWIADAGAPWQDIARMILHVQFDREFLCIVSGTIQQQSCDDARISPMMNFDSSHFYCNAALYSFFVSSCSSIERIADVEERLRRDEASEGVCNLVRKVAQAAQHDVETNECTDPTDYNEL